MERLVFYRGLLLALRSERVSFLASGERFHTAFGLAVDEAASAAARKGFVEMSDLAIDLQEKDPVFGIFRGAEEMILQGMYDLILVLESPRNEIARLKVSKAQAAKELADLPNWEVYEETAKVFHKHLGDAQ